MPHDVPIITKRESNLIDIQFKKVNEQSTAFHGLTQHIKWGNNIASIQNTIFATNSVSPSSHCCR